MIWEWEESYDDNITHVSETNSIANSSNSLNSNTDSDATQCSTVVQSTVTFKCIGCQHRTSSQDTLEVVSELLDQGEAVPVNVFPEEENPHDSKAIAFKCWVNNKWKRIGYVVKEARDAVHEARRAGIITQVPFKWAKYKSRFGRSGPGLYAGINITKYGAWGTEVHRCASSCN